MPAARYWRIFHHTVNGGANASWVEVEMFGSYSADAPNLCVGGTPSASSEHDANHSVANAFDGIKNTSTTWASASNQHVNSWIMYDFGVDTEILGVALTSRQTAAINQTPRDFEIQYSLDNVNWVTFKALEGQVGWGSNETRKYYVYLTEANFARPYSLQSNLRPLPSAAKNMFMTGGDGAFSGVARSQQGAVPFAVVRVFDMETGLLAGITQADVIGEWSIDNLNSTKEYFLVCTNPDNSWEQVISSQRFPYKKDIVFNLRRTLRHGETLQTDLTIEPAP